MHGLIDFVFPPRCAGCDRPGTLLCDDCRDRLPLIAQGEACRSCGAPCSGPCAECRSRAFAFSSALCSSLLGPPVSRAVVLLKDGGERRYAVLLAEILARAATGWLRPDEILVPVPASPEAVRRRGFDHAADITRSLGRMTGMPVARPLVARPTGEQRALGRQERFENRRQAFGPRPGTLVPDRVVLVDDVFTTGATLDAAARVLRASGCADVRALAVARACGRPPHAVKIGAAPATLLVLSPGSVVADVSAS